MSSNPDGKSVVDVEEVFNFIEMNKITNIDKAIRDDYQYFRRPNPTLDVFQRMVNRLIEKHGYRFPIVGKNRGSSSKLKNLETTINKILEMKQSLELVVRGVSIIQEQVNRHEKVLTSRPQSQDNNSKFESSFDFKLERMISNQSLMLNRIEKIEDYLHSNESNKRQTSPIDVKPENVKTPMVPKLTNSDILEKKSPKDFAKMKDENPLQRAPQIPKSSSLSEFEKLKKRSIEGSPKENLLTTSERKKRSTNTKPEYDSLRARKGSYSDPIKERRRKKKTYTFGKGRRRPKTVGSVGIARRVTTDIISSSSSMPKPRQSVPEDDNAKSILDKQKSKFEKFQVDHLLKKKSSENLPKRKKYGREVDIVEEKKEEEEETAELPVKIEVRKESGSSFAEPEEVGKVVPLSLIVYGPAQSVLKREFCVKWNGQEISSTKIFRKKTSSASIDRFRFEVRIDKRGTNTITVRYLDEMPVERSIVGCWTLDISKTKMRILVKKKFPNSRNEKWRKNIPCLAERIAHPNEGRATELSQDQLDYMKRAEEKITKYGEPGDIERDGMKIWEKEEVYCVVTFRNEFDVVDLYDGVVISIKRLGGKKKNEDIFNSREFVPREIKLLNNSKTKRGNYIGYIPTDLPGEFEISLVDKVRIIRIYPLQTLKKSPSVKKKREGSSRRGGRFRSAPTSEKRDPEKKVGSPYSRRNLPYPHHQHSPQKYKEEELSPNNKASVPVPKYMPVKLEESNAAAARKEIRIHICGNVGVVKDFPKKLKESLDSFGVKNSVLLQEKVNRTRYLSYQMTWRRKMFDIHLRLNCDSYAPMMDEIGGEMKYLSKNSTTKTAIHIHFVPFVNFNDYTSRYRGKKIKEEDSSFHSGVCLGTIYEDKDDFTFIHTSNALKIEDRRSKEQSIKLTKFYNDNMGGLCKLIKKVAINMENVQRIANISLD